MDPHSERDAQGRWLPGSSANPETQWSPDNPPPKSPGRPRRDAWIAELQERLKDPRMRQALADKLLKTALKGSERASLRAIDLIQDRVGGPVVRRVEADIESRGGVLVAPAAMSLHEWIKMATEQNAKAVEPGVEGPK